MTGMRTKVLLAWCLAAALVAPTIGAQVVEPPEYPDGVSCSQKGDVLNDGTVIAPDHKCDCHMVIHDKDCEATASPDATCKQFCHERHCHCPRTCDTSGGPRP